MTRAQTVERLAARLTSLVVRALREDRGIVLDRAGEERVFGVVAEEFEVMLAPPGEAERIVREAFRAGLRPDD